MCPLQCDSTGALRTTGGGSGGDASASNQTTMISSLSAIAGAVHVEDAVHTSGDGGIPALCVRKDVPVALGGSGDYQPCQVNETGALWVTDAGRASRSTVVISGSSWAKGDSEGTLDTSSYSNLDFAIVFSNASATGADWLGIEISSDNSTWVPLQDQGFQAVTDSNSATQYVCRVQLTELAAQYIRFTNTCTAQSTLSDLYLTLH